jgi:HSP20 family protein
MAIQRWEPFREMVSLRDAMNTLLQESFVRPTGLLGDGAGAAAPLPLDISENENEFIVKASLPGVKPEDVQITAYGDTLTIRGEIKAEEEKKDENYHLRERRYGQFVRTVTLSTPISADKAQAQFENGVLTLRLPKAEEAKPKQIKVAPTAAGASNGGASNAGGSNTGAATATAGAGGKTSK